MDEEKEMMATGDESSQNSGTESLPAGLQAEVTPPGKKKKKKGKVFLIAGIIVVLILGTAFGLSQLPMFKVKYDPLGCLGKAFDKNLQLEGKAEGKQKLKMSIFAGNEAYADEPVFSCDADFNMNVKGMDADVVGKVAAKAMKEKLETDLKMCVKDNIVYVKVPDSDILVKIDSGLNTKDIESAKKLNGVILDGMKNSIKGMAVKSEDVTVDLPGGSKKAYKISLQIDKESFKTIISDFINNVLPNDEFIKNMLIASENDKKSAEEIKKFTESIKDENQRKQMISMLNQGLSFVEVKDSSISFYIDDDYTLLGTDLNIRIDVTAVVQEGMSFKAEMSSRFKREPVAEIKTFTEDEMKRAYTPEEIEKDENLKAKTDNIFKKLD